MENRACIGRSSYEGFTGSTLRHAELISASQETLKRVQGDESVSESHCRDINPDLHNSFAQQTVKNYSPKNPPQPSLTKGGRKAAFTLAEVLITLGIIGIVAALTMPVLIQNHKKQETSAKLKKFYSIMFQAIRMSENDNGPATAWEYIAARDESGEEISHESSRKAALVFFNKYLAKYIKYQSIDENPTILDSDQEEGDSSRYIRVYFADGSLVYMKTGACFTMKLDVNGEKGKNEVGKDIFMFVLCPESQANHQCPNNNYFCGYGGFIIEKLDRNNILTSCRNDKGVCTRLLMFDSWEFKSDYPYKL